MTATTEDVVLVEPAPASPSAPPRGRSPARDLRRRGRPLPRPDRGVVSVLCLIALLAAGIGAYFERVVTAGPPASYPVTAPSRQWLQTAPAAAAGWFRAEPVLGRAPDDATLWIDARDMYRVWINGRVAATNRAPARAGAVPTAAAVDVRSLLKPGRNVVAVQVTGLGEQTAALWARLRMQVAGGTVELGTDTAGWRQTSDAAQVGIRLSAPPDFIGPAFPATAWKAPVAIPPIRTVRSAVPDQLLTTTTSPSAFTALTARGFDAVYSQTLDLPRAASDTWLRVAATGALTLSINRHVVLERPAPGYVSPNSHRAAPLSLLHLGNRVHSGSNRLVFHVTGSRATAFAVATMYRPGDAASWVSVGAGQQRWTVQAQGAPIAALPLDTGAAEGIWRNGFASTVVPLAATPIGWQAVGGVALLALLLSSLGAILARRWRQIPSRVALNLVLTCLAPAGAAILTVLAVGRWTSVPVGFPYRSAVAATVILILSAPLLGVATAPLARRLIPAAPLARRLAAAAPLARRLVAERVGRRRWRRPRTVIVALAVLAGIAQGWRIGRQPLWQDEATSIVVARSIQRHGLPRLDSGLYYFKAELYHGLLAVVLSISDSTNVLRSVSLLWFVATVAAFGLLFMPTLTPRPGLQVIATVLFILVPAELAWARDVRMYQQMQFFAVVFLALFIRALRDGRRGDIAGSALALLGMYLSHEESFVLLPALPLMALWSRQVVWARRRMFATAFLPVTLVIAGQYAVSHIHPPDFGKDLSNRPYVGWDPNQADFYYQRVFFTPLQQTGSIAILATLAIIAIIIGIRRRQNAPALAGIALISAVAAVSLVFTAKVDRYSFVTLPLLVALAVLGGHALIGAPARWRVGGPANLGPGGLAGWLRVNTAVAVGIAFCAVLATLVVSPRGFGVWAADITGSANPFSHPDYRPTVGYLRGHLRPDDQVITLAPPVMAAQYLGREPDRVIQTGRNKLLYLVLRDGQPVDTVLGVPVLLTGRQIRIFLEAHPRVWLVSDTGSYIQGVPPDVRIEVGNDFRIMAQDAATTISLWNAG